jgi:uncharacterized iron-regulated protein
LTPAEQAMATSAKARAGVRYVSAVLLAITAVFASPCLAVEVTFRNAAGERLTRAQMLPLLRETRLLLLGEVHGDRRHHTGQAELLRMLLEAGAPLVIGMETFGATGDAELARWTAGELDGAAFYRRFGADWNIAQWPAYRDLFLFIRKHAIPLFGINGDEAIINKVATGGFESLSDTERQGLPPGSCTVDQDYRRLMEKVVGAGMSHAGFRTFCESQTLRDGIMAGNLERLARRSPGSIVVGLTGIFHAWRPALPAHLARLGAGRVLVILPEEGSPKALADLRGKADYVWRLHD